MEQQNYFKVKLTTLHPACPLTFSVYVGIGKHYTLYFHKNTKVDIKKIQSIMAKGNENDFFVLEKEWKAYQQYVHDILNSDTVSNVEKAHILKYSSYALVEKIYEQPNINEALNESKPLIRNFMSLMQKDSDSMSQMLSISGHDFYTYSHCLDVSIYSLGLGRILGLREAELEILGVAALWHDIGKRNIDLKLLHKIEPLTPEEVSQVQQHTHYGLAILSKNPQAPDEAKAVVFEHHENYGGTGFPQQLAGEEIHPFSRIVTICDTYDSLITQRSNNKPMRPQEAFDLMKNHIKGKFDPEMAKAMFSVFSKMTS